MYQILNVKKKGRRHTLKQMSKKQMLESMFQSALSSTKPLTTQAI